MEGIKKEIGDPYAAASQKKHDLQNDRDLCKAWYPCCKWMTVTQTSDRASWINFRLDRAFMDTDIFIPQESRVCSI